MLASFAHAAEVSEHNKELWAGSIITAGAQ